MMNFEYASPLSNARKSSTLRRPIFLAALCALFITILATVALCIAFCIRPNANYAYSILVDAGSTSSKVTVFRWRDWPFLTNRWVQEVNTTKSKKGISEYANDTHRASSSIYTLVSKALKQHVPSSLHSTTSFFLGATAGMRLLEYQNPMQSEAIIEEIRHSAASLGVRVNNQFSDIRIISGSLEGKYAWVSCNYLSKKLGDESGLQPDPEDELIGSLDLGGASTQISFVPAKKNISKHTSIIQLFSEKYHIYSYSFLCYGMEAIKLRYQTTILSNISDFNSLAIPSPCHLRGYEFEVKKAKLLGHACSEPKLSGHVYGKYLELPRNMPDVVKFQGTGDSRECRNIVATFFNSETCQYESCSFNNVYQPRVRGKFYAFSSFMHVMKFLSHDAGSLNNTRNNVNTAIDNYCRKDWLQIISTLNQQHWKYVSEYCFGGVYIDKLLEGYGFVESESWKNIQFVEKVAGTIVSWALGHVIDSTGKITSTAPTSYLNEIGFAVGLTILFFLMVFLIAALIFIKANYKCIRQQ